MRARKVDIGLRDGAHTDLIVGTRQEASEPANEGHRTVTSTAADSHSHHVLLRDETLDETVRAGVLNRNIVLLCKFSKANYHIFIQKLCLLFESLTRHYTFSHITIISTLFTTMIVQSRIRERCLRLRTPISTKQAQLCTRSNRK